jgi:sucrose-phosphate synthase
MSSSDSSGRYIQMFSIHGLLRSENLELGRDADTGGQVNYVLELGKALSSLDAVRRVDLFTRQVSDRAVSSDYGKPVETVNDKFRIIRIRCGGSKYIRKELLWSCLDEFVDGTIKFIKRENAIPDVVHGHYADGGYVARELSVIFGIPFIFTGHSLGRVKKQKMLDEGIGEQEINRKLNMQRRIHAEEDVLKNADMVITSTRQEKEDQYGIYRNRTVPLYRVIPPGLNIEKFYPFYHDLLSENDRDEEARYAQAKVLQELDRFFMHPDKPLILALCRPDKRKNINGLVKAYGEDLQLQAMANLAVFAGIRKDIRQMGDNEREVLTDMLLMLDTYDLYGKMAIPKRHDFEVEVPELYRIAARKKGVFVNPAFTEPFGLTLLEASATGVPVVATNDGGPRDILANCKNGELVDPSDSSAIATAVKEIISNNETWERYSKNGIGNVRKYYTWLRHGQRYMEAVETLLSRGETSGMAEAAPSDAIGRRMAQLNYFIVTDIDNTLIGDENDHLPELIRLLTRHREHIGFGVASGRTVSSVEKILKEHGVPDPDVIISSVGVEIYYGPERHPGRGWTPHIASKWNREKIFRLLNRFDFLEYQEETTQRPFKISYHMTPGKDRLAMIHSLLLENRCRYQLIYSHEKYLDILPYRASKGKAIRYLSYKWNIPLSNFLVCGDSGNDEEMLRGEPLGVVVGNYSPELARLRGNRNVFFANRSCAGGILEAIERYRFIEKATGGRP